MLINSKEDLDGLDPIAKEKALILIAQSVLNWEWNRDLGGWVSKEDLSFVNRLGLSLEDLPDVDPPTKPPIPEPEPPQPDPAAAAKHALSPGTEAFQVFAWMWELSAANTQGNRARSDINGNLALTFLWQGDPAMASAGLDAAFADLWDAAEPPDGYQQIVEDWRDEFHLRPPA